MSSRNHFENEFFKYMSEVAEKGAKDEESAQDCLLFIARFMYPNTASYFRTVVKKSGLSSRTLGTWVHRQNVPSPEASQQYLEMFAQLFEEKIQPHPDDS